MQFLIHEKMKAVLEDPGTSRERKRLVYEFGGLVEAVETVARRADAPLESQEKARTFLAFLDAKEAEHGALFFQEVFLLNIVGEGMARCRYLAQPVIAFLRSALYFHGINWIERYQAAQSFNYLSAHAELVMDLTGRRELKALVALAESRFAEDRPFCISNYYLAELKKRFWAARRQTEDACDQSITLEDQNGSLNRAAEAMVVDRDAVPLKSEDRVQVMLRVFGRDLSATGQRIYLMRHPIAGATQTVPQSLEAELAAMLDGIEVTGDGKANWTEISHQIGISEKAAKKEYLRALHDLLAGAVQEIYGDRLPSGMIRRVLETLRTICRERDLKIRENAGRGMTRLVERWEIALRFVLNAENSSLTASREDDFGQMGMWA